MDYVIEDIKKELINKKTLTKKVGLKSDLYVLLSPESYRKLAEQNVHNAVHDNIKEFLTIWGYKAIKTDKIEGFKVVADIEENNE